MKKEPTILFNNNKNFYPSAIFNNKLFVIIIIVGGAIILNISTISIVYQASLLSLNLGLDIWSTFIILLSSSVGNIFIIKLLTSTFIIALSLFYYFYISKRFAKISQLAKEKEEKEQQQNSTRQKLQVLKISLIFCITLLIFRFYQYFFK